MAYKAPSDHEMTVASQHEMAEMKCDELVTHPTLPFIFLTVIDQIP
jgi:hypothetical protein